MKSARETDGVEITKKDRPGDVKEMYNTWGSRMDSKGVPLPAIVGHAKWVDCHFRADQDLRRKPSATSYASRGASSLVSMKSSPCTRLTGSGGKLTALEGREASIDSIAMDAESRSIS